MVECKGSAFGPRIFASNSVWIVFMQKDFVVYRQHNLLCGSKFLIPSKTLHLKFSGVSTVRHIVPEDTEPQNGPSFEISVGLFSFNGLLKFGRNFLVAFSLSV